MGIKQLHNDNLRKLPNEYREVSVMLVLVKVLCVFSLFVFLTSLHHCNVVEGYSRINKCVRNMALFHGTTYKIRFFSHIP